MRRRAVIEEFVSRRLLTIDAGHLEVTHEALLTGWPRLATWLEEDALGQAVPTGSPGAGGRRLGRRSAADRPALRGSPPGLRSGVARPARCGPHTGRAGVPPCVAGARGSRLAAAPGPGAPRAGRPAPDPRRLAVVLALVTVVALAGGLLAAQGKRAADADALRADADRLAAASSTVGTPDLALLLAAQASRTQHTPQTEAALLSAAVSTARSSASTGPPASRGDSRPARTAAPSTRIPMTRWSPGTRRRTRLVS